MFRALFPRGRPVMRFFCIAVTAAMLFAQAPCRAQEQAHAALPEAVLKSDPGTRSVLTGVDVRGWDRLVVKLIDDGVDSKEVLSIYSSAKMPRFGFINFKLKPRESARIYSGFHTQDKLRKAREFMRRYRPVLDSAEDRFGVDREVLVAILLIETHFGDNMGTHLLVNRLSRLAGIAEPGNVRRNFNELRKEDPAVKFEEVEKRALYLEEIFYPELRALFHMAHTMKLDLLSMRGSVAGAFGIPQFLPTSYLRFAVDGDADGEISLFQTADAIHSAANFLKQAGWHPAATAAERREAIWRYNKSDAYIDAVLGVADRLRE